MAKKIYSKLVRDKIPEIIKNKGNPFKISVLSDEDYRRALKLKMEEETKELIDAKTREDILNELADIQELVRSIAKNHDISAEMIENARQEKINERGGFEQRFLLEFVDEKE